MKVCLSLISLFFLKINQEVRGERNLENLVVLQHAETVGPINRIKGENITVTCEFDYTGKTRFFCRRTCEGKNILIQTTEDRDENGRFSIRYEKRSRIKSDFLNVSITDLKPSDSGWYRCRSDKTVLGNVIKTQYADFDLVVTEDSLKPKWTPRPFIRSTFLQAASTTAAAATTTTSTTSSTQTQSFSPSPSETIKSSDPLLYVGLSLAVLIVLLATALLIFCQRKNLHLQKGPPAKIDPTDFTTINTVYEEIRENKPPAGEISSVYVSVQSNKPNAAESNAIYSLASEPQGQAKEEDIQYSEVQLPNDTTRSNGGHLAASDNVTYSEPRLA